MAALSQYVPPFLIWLGIYDEIAVTSPETSSKPAPPAPWTYAQKQANGTHLPQSIAHRGYKAKHPENTLLAFKSAVEAGGASGLETDIHLTSDHVVVLSHDPTLKRCFGRDERIIDVDYSFVKDLRTLREPHEPMPRLDDLLAYMAEEEEEEKEENDNLPGTVVRREDVWLMLDIKLDNDAELVMRRIAETIASVSPHPRKPWNQRVVLGVWAYKYLALCAKYMPDFPIAHIGFSTGYAQRFMAPSHANVGFSLVIASLYLRPSFIKRAKEKGRPVFVWTVNGDDWMRWCVEKGVDGVITDDPKRFNEIRDVYAQGRSRQTDMGWMTSLQMFCQIFSSVLMWGISKLTKRLTERSSHVGGQRTRKHVDT